MTKLEYNGHTLERYMNQWVIWDDLMYEPIFLPLEIRSIEELKDYLDNLGGVE